MDVTFHNVTLTLTGADPHDAYARLCNFLSQLASVDGLSQPGCCDPVELEFQTDTFTSDLDLEDHDTGELFPNYLAEPHVKISDGFCTVCHRSAANCVGDLNA